MKRIYHDGPMMFIRMGPHDTYWDGIEWSEVFSGDGLQGIRGLSYSDRIRRMITGLRKAGPPFTNVRVHLPNRLKLKAE